MSEDTRAESSPASDSATEVDDLAVAKERVSSLLSALDIDVVISVDDAHFVGGAGTAQEVTEAMAAAPELLAAARDLLAGSSGVQGFAEVDEEDSNAVADFVNEYWHGFEIELQEQLLALTRIAKQDRNEAVEGEQIADDLQAHLVLQQLFDGTVDYLPLSMTDWNSRWRELLADRRRYLVLIDRTFTRERDGADELGDQLLAELLDDDRDGVWAGLLTRHAGDEVAERTLTDQLRTTYPKHAHRIAAIGKFRARSVPLLPAGLRALLLVQELDAYRKLAKSALEEAAVVAVKKFDDLSDYAIVEAFAAAQHEGTFELDQAVRLAQKIHSRAIAERLRDPAFASLHLAALQGGSIGAFQNAERDHAKIRSLLHEDVFETINAVNGLGLPLEVGDIFALRPLARRNQDKYFILLGQSCDLSMRGSGKREPALRSVTLSPLTRLKPGAKSTPAKHALGYLDPGSDELWAVDFRAGLDIVVPVAALDATVFNVTGESLIAPAYQESRPMARSWLRRLELLQEQASEIIGKYREVSDDVAEATQRDQILSAMAANLTNAATDHTTGATVQIDAEGNYIRFGVRRHARVRAEIALRVSDVAIHYHGRPAFDSSFVKP
ncbi:hypothetical protein [Microbacterium phyllosphaerae]|uniref:hypothetical protein n=1 Tax=Microbacterium phyllosphaerae TaxID=124798 RepID=UPI003D655996